MSVEHEVYIEVVNDLVNNLDAAADEIERLRARRPVVCGTCRGEGRTATVAADGNLGVEPCPDCGKDGAGPGVRWSE